MADVLKMYDFHVWANKTMFKRLKELPPGIYEQELTSVFSSISKAMAHIYLTDYTWLEILSGQSMRDAMACSDSLKERAESASIDELESMVADLTAKYHAVLQRQGDLEAMIDLDNPYAGRKDISFSDIVIQGVNHGTYHRGNVTAMLRQQGFASVMTEYALFWYQER